ncbi:MAG TPA: PfkB family carbohydrate kinase [Actinomycetota bacterium]|nr:PfkB family carbohydrate kinase [Actinomycetota bacterium]
MIVCLAANPSIDRLFEVDRVVRGETHRPTRFVQVAGGKGLNAARAAATLGADVRAVAILGGHAGRWIAQELDSEEVPYRALWIDGETRSSLSVADRSSGEMTEFYERGETIPESLWPEVTAVLADNLAGADVLTISGSLPPGAPLDGYKRIVELAHDIGVPVVLDAAGDYLERALEAGPDVVKINSSEAAGLFDVQPAEVHSCDAASALRSRAGGEGHAAIITLGDLGIVAAEHDGSEWKGSIDTKGRYPVGSGDAFLGGLALALDRALPWPEALALALGAAAANAELAGAGRLDAARAYELLRVAEVRRMAAKPEATP